MMTLDELERLEIKSLDDVRESLQSSFLLVKLPQSKEGLSRLVDLHEKHLRKVLETRDIWESMELADKKGPSVDLDGKQYRLRDAAMTLGRQFAAAAEQLKKDGVK